MTTTDSKYLDRILALLAKAEDPAATPEEAAAYAAKAHELGVKWQIDEAELAAHRLAGSVAEEVDVTQVWFDFGPYMLPQIQLLAAVADANGCKVVYRAGQYKRDERGYLVDSKVTGGYAKGATALIYGFESGRRVTQIVFASLLIQLEREYRTEKVQAIQAYEAPKPGNRIKWKNGFTQGFTMAVIDRFAAAARRITEQTPGSALALVDRKKQVEAAIGKTKSNRSHAGSWAGRSDGYTAGQRADIGQTGLTHTHSSKELAR